jgi:hypothetical protein
MNLDKFTKMSQHLSSAKTFKGSLTGYLEKIKANTNIDKRAFTFKSGVSDRFNSAQFKFYLEAYTGNYGSSSCYTLTTHNVDNDTLSYAATSWINKNKQLFLDGVAQELELMGKKMLTEAEEEVAKLQAALEYAKQVGENEPQEHN